MNIPVVKLNDGYAMPQLALGLWQVTDEAEFDPMIKTAVEAGYRHFDSAQYYQNEGLLAQALKTNGLKREDSFITTKIAVNNFGYSRTTESIAESLKNLETDYIDLMLLHFPVTLLRKKSWQALEDAQAAGQIRSIGVSNYTIKHLEQMMEYAKVTPAVNQVELHVFLQQPGLVEYCHENGIVVEAYSPLAHARANDNEDIKSIAEKHQKSYAQIMLRWCIQKGLVPLPKSKTPSRIKENIDIFDFELDDDDMKKLAELDQDLRTCWNPTHVP
jgi:diketogulonate reductase-like aldo/keto reductase